MSRLFLCCLLAVAGPKSWSQNFSIKEYTLLDGLSQSQVSCLLETHNGEMWIGTRGGGVNVFNGYEFSHIEEQFSNYTIRCLFQDSRNNIWIGTEGHLFVYDGVHYRNISEEEGIIKEAYNCVFESEGKIYVGTDKGVVVLNEQLKQEKELVSDQIINDIEKDNKGNILIATAWLKVIALKDGKLTNWLGNSQLDVMEVRQICWSPKRLILATNEGVYYEDKYGVYKNYSLSYLEGDIQVNSLHVDKKGLIWVSTNYNGIMREHEGRLINLREEDGLISNSSYQIVTTKTGDVWIGQGLGISVFRSSLFRSYTKASGLSNNRVWSTYMDERGNLWVGTENGGINRINLKEGQEQVDRLVEGVNPVQDITEGKYGDYWVGTHKGGLYHYLSDPYISDRKRIYNEETEFGANSVFCSYKLNENEILFGTEKGLRKLTYGKPGEKPTFRNYDDIEGLPNDDRIYKILKGPQGNLWCLYRSKTIGLVRIRGEKEEDWTIDMFNNNIGLDCNQLMDCDISPSGYMVVGTLGNGIYVFNVSDPASTLTNYGARNKRKLVSSTYFQAYRDAKGDFWLGSAKGIERAELDEDGKLKNIKYFGVSEGFTGRETNMGAITSDMWGNVFIGTINGVVVYKPSKGTHYSKPPDTRLTSLRLFFSEVNWEYELEKPVEVNRFSNVPKDLILPYDKNHVTFDFLGVSLVQADQVQYKFILEGFDNRWSPEGSQRLATYSNLPPGEFTFKVVTRVGKGEWNPNPAVYRFRIAPPFWRTYWFIFICVVFITGVIVFLVKRREFRLKRVNMQLEQKVEERTWELNIRNEQLTDAKELIEKRNQQMMDSIEYAKNIQESILPTDAIFKSYLEKSFVLYKPKDVISGDFYWVYKKFNRIYLAVVDCTGHGVPGALLSVISRNLLDEVVRSKEGSNPGRILESLRNSVERRSVFRESSFRDGMAISLVAFDTAQKKIEFSGSMQSMYLIRNGELIEVKGNRIAIENTITLDNFGTFSNHEMEVQKGDMIYLFSDGFVDQKGGPKGKKYMSKRFKEYLIEISQNEVSEQKQLLDNQFESWKGDFEQYDDVLVIGVRV